MAEASIMCWCQPKGGRAVVLTEMQGKPAFVCGGVLALLQCVNRVDAVASSDVVFLRARNPLTSTLSSLMHASRDVMQHASMC